MKQYAVNPYLPLWEYVPDGEPRLFEGRVYLYGSHDTAGGDFFCLEDYVAWSAPESDLSDWRYEGVIYRRDQDPSNPGGKLELFAPDVVRGPDGRYYLYYCLRMLRQFGVAVSDRPQGPFEFYGHIRKPDGADLDAYMPYDPSVLVDDDGKIYLYYGFSSEMLSQRFGTEVSPGAMVVELAPDMVTAVTEPVCCVPWEGLAAGTEFEGHAYFEAPSMRKLDGRYYLIYSSQWCRELCYAVSDRPDGGFTYGGVIVDNGDMGMNGRTKPVCIPGNNHGGLVRVGGRTYMFYHRHTHATSYSRQGCAQEVTVLPDGSIPQVEITSCGLNGGPLPAEGRWPAAIACHLTGPDPEYLLNFRNVDRRLIPYIYETCTERDGREQFVHNFVSGSTLGFKYFEAKAPVAVTLRLRGNAKGRISLLLDGPEGKPMGGAEIDLRIGVWTDLPLTGSFTGTHAVYLRYEGQGSLDLLGLEFNDNTPKN